MGIIADTHVFGSRKGYECLSKSPGVAAAEDAVLSEFGFGQCSDERYLAGLAASATAFGRSLPSGRMAITRVIRGPVDDGGRPTHEQRTLIVSAADYQVLRHSLSRLVNDQSVWSSASFAAGRTIALPPSAATSGPPGPRDWQIFDAWVLGKDQEKAVVVGDDDQSAEAVMALAGRLTNADALTYRWGVRMLAAITWVDAITLSRFGVLDGRRAVHGVSQGACIHPKVQEAYRARPNQLPALAALQQATAIEQEPFGLEVIDEEIPSNVTSAPTGVAVRQRPRRVSSYVWVAATSVSVVCLGFVSFFAFRAYDAGRRPLSPPQGERPADPQPPTSVAGSGNGQGTTSSAQSPPPTPLSVLPPKGEPPKKAESPEGASSAAPTEPKEPDHGPVGPPSPSNTREPAPSGASGGGGNHPDEQSSDRSKLVVPPSISQEDTTAVKQTITWLKDVKDFSFRVHGLLDLANRVNSEVFAPKNSRTLTTLVKAILVQKRNSSKSRGGKEVVEAHKELDDRLEKFAELVGPPPQNHISRIQAEVDLDSPVDRIRESCPKDVRKLTEEVRELAELLSNVHDSLTTLSAERRGASAMRLCLLLHAVELLSAQQDFPTGYSLFNETWLKFTRKDDYLRASPNVKKSNKAGDTDRDWAALERCQDVMLGWAEGGPSFHKSADATTTTDPSWTWMELANTLQEQGFYINPTAAVKPASRKSASSPRPNVAGFYLQRDQWPSLDVPGALPGSVFSSLELFNALIGKGLWDASTMELINEVRDALWQPDMGLEK